MGARKSRNWVCIRCAEKFNSGQWLGCSDDPTLAHEVETKTYYAREERLTVSIRPDTRVIIGNTPTPIPGKMAHFLGGVYVTTDPEEQEVLDTRPYLLSREQYEEARLNDQQKIARLKSRSAETNSLLAEARRTIDQLKADNARLANAVGVAVQQGAAPTESKPKAKAKAKAKAPTTEVAGGSPRPIRQRAGA